MNTKSNLPSNKNYFSNSENKAWKKKSRTRITVRVEDEIFQCSFQIFYQAVSSRPCNVMDLINKWIPSFPCFCSVVDQNKEMACETEYLIT